MNEQSCKSLWVRASARWHKMFMWLLFGLCWFNLWPQCCSGFVDMAVLTCVCQYLEFCDDILVLEDGEVLESGDHQALMKASGRYAQLISNYQMEQSKVKSQTHSTKLRCPVTLRFLQWLSPYFFTSCKSFSPVIYGPTSSKTIKAKFAVIQRQCSLSVIYCNKMSYFSLLIMYRLRKRRKSQPKTLPSWRRLS